MSCDSITWNKATWTLVVVLGMVYTVTIRVLHAHDTAMRAEVLNDDNLESIELALNTLALALRMRVANMIYMLSVIRRLQQPLLVKWKLPLA